MTLEIKEISRTQSFLSRFKIDEVVRWLQNPSQYEKQIRSLSNYLYNVSSYYRRLIYYIGMMPRYDYKIKPYDIPDSYDIAKYKKQFKKVATLLEKMEISHEFINVFKTVLKEDYYFGYIHESKDSFFFQKLSADYCRISSKEDGVLNFKYDMSSFNSNKELLDAYPLEFKQKYQTYKDRGNDYQWQELDSDKTICIKLNDDTLDYGIPFFNIVFEAIFNADEYGRMKKTRAKADNFMLLVQQVPMKKDANEMDQFLISPEMVQYFHSAASQSVGDGINLVTTPMPIESIKTDTSKADRDVIAEAVRDIHNESGVSQHLFNSDKTTSTGLAQSIITDEQIVIGFLKQVERWINRRLKKMQGQYKFKLQFLHNTVFNQEDKFDMYLRGAQSGLPTIVSAAASIGITPLELLDTAILENDILGLHDMLKPLATSHTQSGKDKAGAPKKSDSEISDSGQINRDNNTDENRE